MKKFTLIVISAFLTGVLAAQEPSDKCAANIVLQQELAKDPLLAAKKAQFDNDLKAYLAANPQLTKGEKNTSGIRIIPVVFHIIHNGGSENLTKAQILDQLRVMNEDFRRLNADASTTPEAFDSVAADCRIEFRLANIDPDGNCTDGILRIQSYRTNGGSNGNGAKELSYWNRDKYLNIWIVKDIGVSSDLGSVIGYAQFPLGGATRTDGVVLANYVVGSIGTSNFKGRTATHEIGHWLGLRHIWGDEQCGNDGVADTPVHFGANQAPCYTFPRLRTGTEICAGRDSIRGEMYMNYMDYTGDACLNMFSKGQKRIMDFTLEGPVDSISGLYGFREKLWSQANLDSTGTKNTTPQPCAPIAEFFTNTQMICEGKTVNLTDNSYNGTIVSREWTLDGATYASNTTSASANPVAKYVTPGIYNVALTATNTQGSSTKTRANYVIVSSNTPDRATSSWYVEDFTDVDWFNSKFFVFNDDSTDFKWKHTYGAGSTPYGCVYVNNFGNYENALEVLVTPSYDLSQINTPVSLRFRYSCAARDTSFEGSLQVFSSVNCGQSWSSLGAPISGAPLANAGLFSSPYLPQNVTSWAQKTVSIPTSVANKTNVRFKFEFKSKSGANNLYLDDINITDPTAVAEDLASAVNLNLYPNPATGNGSVLVFTLDKGQKVNVEITDMVGRKVAELHNGQMGAGKQNVQINQDVFNAAGVYFVRLQIGNQTAVKKLIVAQQ